MSNQNTPVFATGTLLQPKSPPQNPTADEIAPLSRAEKLEFAFADYERTHAYREKQPMRRGYFVKNNAGFAINISGGETDNPSCDYRYDRTMGDLMRATSK